jgi:hypothetical protein
MCEDLKKVWRVYFDDWGNGSNFRPNPKEKYWKFLISICLFHCESGNSKGIVLPAATSGRSLILWAGNNGKLNLLASKHLNQGIRQEMPANASNNADLLAEIRALKRDSTQELDHGNFKHSGQIFLVRRTCEELNANPLFQQFLPPHYNRLGIEVCRPKIREYTEIAVNTPIEEIDPGN